MKGTESIYRGKNKLEVLSNYAIRHGLRGLLCYTSRIRKTERTMTTKEDNMKNTLKTEFPGIGDAQFTSA